MNDHATIMTKRSSENWLSSVLVQLGLAVVNSAIVFALVPYYVVTAFKKVIHTPKLDRSTPSHSAAVPLKSRVTLS